MSRSLYKLPNLNLKSSVLPFKSNSNRFKTLLAKSFLKKKPDFVINEVSQIIYPSLLAKKAIVYCGNSLNLISFKKSMIGLPIKNFVRTKKTGSLIHIEKKSKKKK